MTVINCKVIHSHNDRLNSSEKYTNAIHATNNSRNEGKTDPDGVGVVPSDLLRKLAEKAVLVTRLQPQNPASTTKQQHQTQAPELLNRTSRERRKGPTYLSASGMTIRLVLSYGGGTPS
jgi:hypothetical protein